MKKLLLLPLYLAASIAFGQSLQNEDFKSAQQIESAAGTITANLASGTNCILLPSSTAGLSGGMYVYDTTNPSYIPANTTVVAIPGTCSAGQIQISANATHNASADTITFGGTAAQLLNDTKIWVSSLTSPEQLSASIGDGSLFKASSVLTTDGDILVYGSTTQRLPAGTPGQYLQTNGTSSPPSWAAVPGSFTAVNQSSTYSVPSGGYVVNMSGSSFVVTLPTVVGQTQDIVLVHQGTSLTSVYTINTTGGQTITGPGGTVASGVYALYTNGEAVTLTPNPTNSTWVVRSHYTDTGWVSAGTVSVSATSAYTFTITSATVVAGDTYSNNSQVFTVTSSGTVTSMPTSGTGGPTASGTLTKVSGSGPSTLTFSSVSSSVPAKGTVITDQLYYSRRGNRCLVRVRYAQSTAGTGGSGDYIFYMPANMLIDLSASGLTAYTGSVGSLLFGIPPVSGLYSAVAPNLGIQISQPGGFFYTLRADAFIYAGNSYRVSQAYFSSVANAINNSTSTSVNGGTFGYNAGNINWEWTLDLPISGWQP